MDIYYSHRVENEGAAIEFTQSCARLIEEGWMKHIGMSEICGSWLRQAHKIHPILAVQQEWSLLTRSLEVELLPVCAELGVGVVAYSPLARNLLTVPEKVFSNLNPFVSTSASMTFTPLHLPFSVIF